MCTIVSLFVWLETLASQPSAVFTSMPQDNPEPDSDA